MLIFDAHLDLSMNALEWNRDLTRPIAEIRQREKGLRDKPDRENGAVNLPEMRKGRIGICVATQIARYVKPASTLPGWHSPAQAWAQSQGQLAWYKVMEELGEMTQIRDADGLRKHLALWGADGLGDGTHAAGTVEDQRPIGYILSLEGADSILTPQHLEPAYAQGLRAVGPAHYGPGTYARGTHAKGGLGPRGKELLQEMERLGIILDATHLCDESLREALDNFHGRVWASHSNCRALVPDTRQSTDEQIKELVDRGAVIGTALDAWMMIPGWVRGHSTPQNTGLKLEVLIDHIDHICQVAGNARHVGIGSDLDGAFGKEQTAGDLETIADLDRIPGMLQARGYSEDDIAAISHGNFIRFLLESWK